MKKSSIKITAALIASAVLFSACTDTSSGRRNRRDRDDDDDESEVVFTPDDFNTTLDYSELDQCSYSEENMNTDYHSYSFDLMRQVLAQEERDANVMISPASVMFALDVCAAGANGDTLSQITNLFSEGADPLEQQAFASDLMTRLNESQDVEFSVANAIWSNSDMLASGINPDYADFIDEYYDAEAVAEPFSMSTVEEINNWIDDKTDGMIDRVLEEINPDAAFIIANAIAFEGQWADPYLDHQVNTDTFTTASGDQIDVQMMNGSEYFYYESDKATGFFKYYSGGQFALVVMLPTDETISANEFLENFSAEDYEEFISSRTTDYDVYTKLPEFTYDYDTLLNQPLVEMGATAPFSYEDADFTGIGIPDNDENVFISRVIHKTHIELDRNGTRAAAATVVEMAAGCALDPDPAIRYVYCDRPFAYAIVDTANNNPIFIGTYNG